LFQANIFLLHRYALLAASVLCQTKRMVLLQATLTVCETTNSFSPPTSIRAYVDLQSHHPRWCVGHALMAAL